MPGGYKHFVPLGRGTQSLAKKQELSVCFTESYLKPGHYRFNARVRRAEQLRLK